MTGMSDASVVASVWAPQAITLRKLKYAVNPAPSVWKNPVQCPAVRKAVGAMSVPEQMGKICPFVTWTMNAPTLLYVLARSGVPLTI